MFAMVDPEVDVRLCGLLRMEKRRLIRLPPSSSAPGVLDVETIDPGDVGIIGLDIESRLCVGTN
jgi:hypothetical protein